MFDYQRDCFCPDQKLRDTIGVPLFAKEIIAEATARKEQKPIDDFSMFLDCNENQLQMCRAEDFSEVYFSYKNQINRICGHGLDFKDGTDSKSVLCRVGARFANIGNVACKESLRIGVIHGLKHLLLTEEPIPVPGNEDSFRVPITPEGLVWDQWEFAHHFRPQDIGPEKFRKVSGEWGARRVLPVIHNWEEERFRIDIKDRYQYVVDGDFDLIHYFRNEDKYPIYLNRDYFARNFHENLKPSITSMYGRFPSHRAKHRGLFPLFMYCLDGDTIEERATFSDGSIDERNIATLKELLKDEEFTNWAR